MSYSAIEQFVIDSVNDYVEGLKENEELQIQHSWSGNTFNASIVDGRGKGIKSRLKLKSGRKHVDLDSTVPFASLQDIFEDGEINLENLKLFVNFIYEQIKPAFGDFLDGKWLNDNWFVAKLNLPNCSEAIISIAIKKPVFSAPHVAVDAIVPYDVIELLAQV